MAKAMHRLILMRHAQAEASATKSVSDAIAGGDAQLWLSGTVRAHVETPLAYVLIGGLALGTAITLLLLSRAISDWPT